MQLFAVISYCAEYNVYQLYDVTCQTFTIADFLSRSISA